MSPLLFTHFAACAFMTGVIWFVQLVHYPSFHLIDPARFPAFAQRHQRETTWVVGPPMLLEVATWVALVLKPQGATVWLLVDGAALLLIWVCTGALSVPLHHRLNSGYDAATVHRLVVTNWPRTLLWTFRSLWLALA